MLNTRASLNKAFAGANLGITLLLDDYENLKPGAGTYPAVVVRILNADAPEIRHLGRQTPESPAGAHRYTLVVEVEVRTNSPTWNEAMRYVDRLRAALDDRRHERRTWLLPDGTPNPTPAAAGFLRFNRASLALLQDEAQPQYKSAFLTWEVQVEVPIS